jgi:hypothetical protein
VSDVAAPLGVPIEGPGLPPTLESTHAGGYYCAHTWFVANRHAATSRVAKDDDGDPMIGFLHVPPDPWTLGAGAGANDAPGPRDERHRATERVVAAALRGWLEQLDAASQAGGLAVVVTGFGPFKEVVDNPTGALCGDSDAMRRVLDLALPDRASSCVGTPLDVARALHLGVVLSRAYLPRGEREVTLFHRALPVDDDVLDANGPDALRDLLEQTQASAWLGLGVSRSASFRVEVRPTSAGLDLCGARPRHDKGRAAEHTLPDNRSLARAIARGAQALAAASRVDNA